MFLITLFCRTRMDHVSNQSALFLNRTPRGKLLWLIQEMFWFMTSTKLTCLMQMVRNNIWAYNAYKALKWYFNAIRICCDVISVANILKLSDLLLILTLFIFDQMFHRLPADVLGALILIVVHSYTELVSLMLRSNILCF